MKSRFFGPVPIRGGIATGTFERPDFIHVLAQMSHTIYHLGSNIAFYLVGLANEKSMVRYLWRKTHRYFLSAWLSKSDNFFPKSTGQIDLARGVLFTSGTKYCPICAYPFDRRYLGSQILQKHRSSSISVPSNTLSMSTTITDIKRGLPRAISKDVSRDVYGTVIRAR